MVKKGCQRSLIFGFGLCLQAFCNLEADIISHQPISYLFQHSDKMLIRRKNCKILDKIILKEGYCFIDIYHIKSVPNVEMLQDFI